LQARNGEECLGTLAGDRAFPPNAPIPVDLVRRSPKSGPPNTLLAKSR
jgi:hypothetical protein